MNTPETKNQFVLRLLFVCLLVFVYQAVSIANDHAARSGDSLYTLILADNIASGRGYGLDAVMHFHKKYPAGTWVVDCFRAPLGPLFFSVVTQLFGKSVFWPNVITAGLSTFLVPVLVYLLALEIFANVNGARWSAYAAALHPLLAEFAMSCTYDMLGVILALISILFFFKALRNPTFLLPAGVGWGLSYLTKESFAVILPILMAATLMLVVFGKLQVPRKFWMFCAVAALVFVVLAAPWHIRCAGIPIDEKLSKSDIGHKCGFYDKETVYADKIPLWLLGEKPGRLDRFTATPLAKVSATIARNWFSGLHHLFLNVFIPGETELKSEPDLASPYFGIPFETLLECERIVHGESFYANREVSVGRREMKHDAVALALSSMTLSGFAATLFGKTLFTGLIGALALCGLWQMRRNPRVILLAALLFLFVGAVSVMTFTHIRYLLFLYPVVAVIGVEFAMRKWRGIPAPAMLTMLFSLLLGYWTMYSDWHFPPHGSFNAVKLEKRLQRVRASKFIAENTDPQKTVVLCDGAAWINFYAGRKAVEIPYHFDRNKQRDVLLDVMRQYKVTHVLIPEDVRFNGKLFEPLRDSVARGEGWLALEQKLSGASVYRVPQKDRLQVDGRNTQ